MYEDYEVHKTRPAWDGELIAVLKNGNKGRIVTMTTGGNLPTVFQVLLSEDGTCPVNEREIDHYLTPPKSGQLPNHPGLWQDDDGDLWVYDGCILRLVRNDEVWTATGPTIDTVTDKRYEPFTELEVKEKQ